MSTWFRTYSFGEIMDGLVIGAYPTDAGDVEMLSRVGIKRVLNLVQDEEYEEGEREEVAGALRDAGIDEYRIPLTDYGSLPAPALDDAVAQVDRWLDDGLLTYVHCRAGWQRSATVAAAVVAVRRDLDAPAALAWVKEAKPSADPLEHQRQDLTQWLAERIGRERS